MRRTWCCAAALVIAGCPTSQPSGEPSSASASSAPEQAPLTGTDLCHALLLAPLDRKLASCKTVDQGADLEAEKEAVAKTHAQCLEQIARPLEEGRLALDESKARACIASIERLGDAWVGHHALALNLAQLTACRALLGPRQGAGDVCTTPLECPSQLTCVAAEGTVGRCAKEDLLGRCSRRTLSFGIARRNECLGAMLCVTPDDTVESVGLAKKRKPPALRVGKTSITGDYPFEVVQRVVRQRFGHLRSCYEAALREKPDLKGEARVSFSITKDGSTTAIVTDGSTLPDKTALDCIRQSFAKLSFPNPDKKPLRVVQNLVFGNPPAKEPSTEAAKPTPPRAVDDAFWPYGRSDHCGSAPSRPLACGFHIDCAVDEYCSTGSPPPEPNRCVPRKPAGSECAQSSECKGRCKSGVCASWCGSD